MARPAYSQPEVREIRKRIRGSALRVFQREDYRGASLRKIAGEMGWSSAALYRYYSGKDELFAAIRAEGFESVGTLIATTRRAASSPTAAVRSVVHAYIRFALEEPGLYRLMFELDQGEVPARDEVRRARELAFEQARRLADDAIAAGIMRGDRNTVAHVFWIAVHGLIASELAGQLDLGRSLDELIDPVIVLLTGRLGALQGGKQ